MEKRKTKTVLRILIMLCAVMTVALTVPFANYVFAAAENPNISISFDTHTINPGESKTWTTTLSNTAVSPKMDVLYVVDTTGSMSSIRGTVANSLNQFTRDLTSAGAADIQFGAAFFGDANVDNPWFGIQLPLGSYSLATVQSAISALSKTGGGDTPEDELWAYMRTIHETPWRQDSQRVVIMITDAATILRPSTAVGGYPVSLAGAAAMTNSNRIQPVLMSYNRSASQNIASALGVTEHIWSSQASLQNALAKAVIPPKESLVDYQVQARLESVTYKSDGAASNDLSVSISPASIALRAGETKNFTLTATGKSITERYNDTAVAKIGYYVDGVRMGDKTQTLELVIPPKKAEGVLLSESSKIMQVSDTYKLEATVLPENATNKNVTWASSAADTAEVSGDGIVTAKAEGTVEITVTTQDGGFTASCIIQIKIAGDGTAENPYQIRTPQNLRNIQAELDKHYILVNDISLEEGSVWTPLGSIAQPFTGSLNGNGHKITNLLIQSSFENAGLFACIANAEIKDLTLENVDVKGINYVGAISGEARGSSRLENCFVTGTIKGIYCVGGLLGSATRTVQVTACTMSGALEGRNYIGGIIGYYIGVGSIEGCSAEVIINGGETTGKLIGNE